jgi:hypothetical protein
LVVARARREHKYVDDVLERLEAREQELGLCELEPEADLHVATAEDLR